MTEAEWLASTNPTPMLEYLRGKASDRKLRLFAVACCCRTLTGSSGPHDQEDAILGLVERCADGELTIEQVRSEDTVEWYEPSGEPERWAVLGAAGLTGGEGGSMVTLDAHEAALEVSGCVSEYAACRAMYAASHAPNKAWDAGREAELPELCRVVREVFGNPFRPVTADPAWLRPNVLELAQTIYDERAFDRLPKLADALEKAGCTHSDILAHCRQPGEHVRGCWVVDLILGKE